MAQHKFAVWGLAFIAFIESFIFPIPTAVVMVPMAQAKPSRAYAYAALCTIMSVLGGIVGYFLGAFAYDSIALPVLEHLGKTDSMSRFRDMADQYGAVAVFGAGLTPFPYKVITILSGALHLNFAVFVIASVFARAGQFFLLAWIVRKFGDKAETFIKKHFAAITLIAFILIVTGWMIWNYSHTG